MIGRIMPRKEQRWVTFQTSDEERRILEEFSKQSQGTKTEILKELVRGLGEHSSSMLQSLPHEIKQEENGYTHQIEVSSPRKPYHLLDDLLLLKSNLAQVSVVDSM
jgi:hypothetical protein